MIAKRNLTDNELQITVVIILKIYFLSSARRLNVEWHVLKIVDIYYVIRAPKELFKQHEAVISVEQL